MRRLPDTDPLVRAAGSSVRDSGRAARDNDPCLSKPDRSLPYIGRAAMDTRGCALDRRP
jgi:hypothetical protein